MVFFGLLRVYSWIFETLLCLLAIGVAIVSLTVGAPDPVSIGWLPWSAHTLPAWLIGFGVVGLIFVVLAIAGRLRILFFLFAAAVFVLMGKGLFFSAISFQDAAEGRNAFLAVLGSLVAVIGAWPSGRRRRDYRTG